VCVCTRASTRTRSVSIIIDARLSARRRGNYLISHASCTTQIPADGGNCGQRAPSPFTSSGGRPPTVAEVGQGLRTVPRTRLASSRTGPSSHSVGPHRRPTVPMARPISGWRLSFVRASLDLCPSQLPVRDRSDGGNGQAGTSTIAPLRLRIRPDGRPSARPSRPSRRSQRRPSRWW
jgi:hypothetical protein